MPAALPDKDNKYVEPKLAFWARLASLAKLSLNTQRVFKDNKDVIIGMLRDFDANKFSQEDPPLGLSSCDILNL